jgi:hypothetical protein
LRDGEAVEPVGSVVDAVVVDGQLAIPERPQCCCVQLAARFQVLDHEEHVVHDDIPRDHFS